MAVKYQMIAKELEVMLLSGKGGGKLPTEGELCQQYGCSRQTVRSALSVLQEKGLIVRRQGSGSYPIRLPHKSSRQMVMLLKEQETATAANLVRKAREAADAVGCSLMCLETHGSQEEERKHLQALLQHRPVGVIVEPIEDVMGSPNQELLQALRAGGVPLVYLGGRYDSLSPCVSGDEAEGGCLLASYLAGVGHRRIAAILKWDDSKGIQRFHGLAQGAGKAGILFRPENCMWYSGAELCRLMDGDNRSMQRFLREYRGDSTAVVCFDDAVASRVQRYLHQHQEEQFSGCHGGEYAGRADDHRKACRIQNDSLDAEPAPKRLTKKWKEKTRGLSVTGLLQLRKIRNRTSWRCTPSAG